MKKEKGYSVDNLTLNAKKEVVKNNPVDVEKAIQQIHESKPVQQEGTKRTTLDIPISLHKKIKMKLIDKGQTIRNYFLELVEKDMK